MHVVVHTSEDEPGVFKSNAKKKKSKKKHAKELNVSNSESILALKRELQELEDRYKEFKEKIEPKKRKKKRSGKSNSKKGNIYGLLSMQNDLGDLEDRFFKIAEKVADAKNVCTDLIEEKYGSDISEIPILNNSSTAQISTTNLTQQKIRYNPFWNEPPNSVITLDEFLESLQKINTDVKSYQKNPNDYLKSNSQSLNSKTSDVAGVRGILDDVVKNMKTEEEYKNRQGVVGQNDDDLEVRYFYGEGAMDDEMQNQMMFYNQMTRQNMGMMRPHPMMSRGQMAMRGSGERMMLGNNGEMMMRGNGINTNVPMYGGNANMHPMFTNMMYLNGMNMMNVVDNTKNVFGPQPNRPNNYINRTVTLKTNDRIEDNLNGDANNFISMSGILTSNPNKLQSNAGNVKLNPANLKSDPANLRSQSTIIKTNAANLKSSFANLKSNPVNLKAHLAKMKSNFANLKLNGASVKQKLEQNPGDTKSDPTCELLLKPNPNFEANFETQPSKSINWIDKMKEGNMVSVENQYLEEDQPALFRTTLEDWDAWNNNSWKSPKSIGEDSVKEREAVKGALLGLLNVTDQEIEGTSVSGW